ncbi:MAG TPA: hypothetical protein VNP93_08685 [Gaiellaceae bacterium]|nr:hypothetical protein [Gaiellaceae bacterium]
MTDARLREVEEIVASLVRIEVDFGGRHPTSTEHGQVDDLLASIAVEPSSS